VQPAALYLTLYNPNPNPVFCWVQVTFLNGSDFIMVKQHAISAYTVESASFSPGGKVFVAGGSDMWVHLYDYETGRELDVNKGEDMSGVLSMFARAFKRHLKGVGMCGGVCVEAQVLPWPGLATCLR
jgi:hypothetical protein